MTETWKLTLPCTRAEADALAGDLPALAAIDPTPVLVTSEPDPARPDDWQLDVYFENSPSDTAIAAVTALLSSATGSPVEAVPLPPQDWVTISQSGFDPLTVGRFHVRTPHHAAAPDKIEFIIPAGLAFGTGQHATTSGCLGMIDGLKRRGAVFRDMLDLGTGTGLLAFAAMKCWPNARAAASDIDSISIDVAHENAETNAIRIGRGPGALMLAVADGLNDRSLVARAPYDLVIANILAQPLILLAPVIAASLAPRGTVILAGLLDSQADAVAAAYRRQRLRLAERTYGEWPVLRMVGR